MTLSRAEIQVADAFADGQAYVALSRVTSLAGLWTAGGAITQQSVNTRSSSSTGARAPEAFLPMCTKTLPYDYMYNIFTLAAED